MRPGDRCQLLLEEAFWDVRIDEILGSDPNAPTGKPFIVSSLMYAATHAVAAEQLRPLWRWGPGDEGSGPHGWWYQIYAGSGVVEPALKGAASSCAAHAIFLFADGVARRHSPFFHSRKRELRAAAHG